MFQRSVAIAICILLQGTLSHPRNDPEKQLPRIAEESQCNGYCYSVLKLVLDHFVSFKDGSGSSNELKDKIHSLENTLKDGVLESTKTQLKDKDYLISEKDQRIRDLQDQLNSTNAVLSEEGETINKLRDTAKSLQSQLENTETQLKDKDNLISEKDQRIQDLQDQLNSTNARFSEEGDTIKKLRDTARSLQSQLENTKTQLKDKENHISEKDQRIQDLQDQLNSTNARFSEEGDTINKLRDTAKSLQSQLENTETQLKDKDNLISEKDQRIRDLQDQLNFTISRFSEINDQLKTCNEMDLPNTCPSGSPNGIYQIKLWGSTPFKVPCVATSSGWTVVLRRIDGSENFNRTWNDYRDGFGDLSGEFFIGLEKLHLMTQSQRHELHIQLRDVNGSSAFAKYDDFIVGSEEEAYKLKSLGTYSGTAGDSLIYHLKMKFTTLDRDNDVRYRNCADICGGGGWWYKHCATNSLTGKYYKDGRRSHSGDYGITWDPWRGYNISLTFVQMMIRPKTPVI